MTREELVYKLFGIDQEKKIYLYTPEIEEHLTKQTDKVTIEVREVEWEDPSLKIQNPHYLDDELLNFTETGIRILHVTPQVTKTLKQYLPRTVKELTIPSTFLEDLSFLQEFPNLETLNISDYSTLPKEVIEYIEKNTSIRNVTFRSSHTLNQVKCHSGFNIIEAGNIVGQYGKLTLFSKCYKGVWSPIINIYTSEYSKNNIETLEALYEAIRPHLPNVTDVSLFSDPNNKYISEVDLEVKDKVVTKLTARNITPTELDNIYKPIIKRANVETTKYTLENKTYDDIKRLKQINSTSNLILRYRSHSNCSDATYEEFQNMRATIDYYKEILETSDLSPVEKVAYVYDILKTMRYQENEEDKSRSRNIHSIVTDGSIVCVGYAAFAKQLLNEVGIRCLNVGVTCLSDVIPDAGHARNFVRVDDDKYNIHGLFAMDITWDSDKDIAVIEEEGEKAVVSRPDEETRKKIVTQYDSLILYRHFLIPMDKYELRYPNESNPMIYEAYKSRQASRLVEQARQLSRGEIKQTEINNIYLQNQHNELFSPEEGTLTVEQYFNEPKPSLETFEQILSNVRKAQGYDLEATKEEVDRVVELHQMLASQNPNSPDHFFKPQGSK